MKNILKPPFGFLKHSIKYEFQKYKDYVDSLSEEEWNFWNLRQTSFLVHSNTKSIKIQWIPLDVNSFDKKKIEFNEPYYSITMNYLSVLINYLKNYYDGEIYKIILTKLNPFSNIDIHTDSGFSLTVPHRIHIPITTNNNILFGCGDKIINMREGEVFEINNSLPHFVINNSKNYRVHLIIDVISLGG